MDFVCLEKKLVVELDGGQHADQVAYDRQRTRNLNESGYRVIRFWDTEVLEHPESVLQVIYRELDCPLA